MLFADLFCFYDSWVVYVFWGDSLSLYFIVAIELNCSTGQIVVLVPTRKISLVWFPCLAKRSHSCWVLLFVCMLWQNTCKWQRVKEKWHVTCLVCCIKCKVTKCILITHTSDMLSEMQMRCWTLVRCMNYRFGLRAVIASCSRLQSAHQDRILIRR
jgi:hypothetical protein